MLTGIILERIHMNIDKEEQIFQKRVLELSRIAYNKGICTYTDFLNLNEINLFYTIKHEIPDIKYELFGGYEGAERKVICFYGEDSVKAFSSYMTCIRILPLNKKFSDDLNHRDFLGAILNLGIERNTIGDILVKEKEGFVFCENVMSNFIIDNLSKVKHTNVHCEILNEDAPDIQPTFQEIRGTVSSQRLDSIISLALNSSRSSILGLIAGGKVFVDGRLVESNSYMLKENETVSVRGHGKFIYKEMQNQTKKGRYYVTLLKYV
jgi:RNA-binding protein YlmH